MNPESSRLRKLYHAACCAACCTACCTACCALPRAAVCTHRQEEHAFAPARLPFICIVIAGVLAAARRHAQQYDT